MESPRSYEAPHRRLSRIDTLDNFLGSPGTLSAADDADNEGYDLENEDEEEEEEEEEEEGAAEEEVGDTALSTVVHDTLAARRDDVGDDSDSPPYVRTDRRSTLYSLFAVFSTFNLTDFLFSKTKNNSNRPPGMHEPCDRRSRRLSRVGVSVQGLTPAIDDAKVAATPMRTEGSNADKERQSEHEKRKADRERRIEDSVAAAARAELEQREALRQDKEREVRNE